MFFRRNSISQSVWCWCYLLLRSTAYSIVFSKNSWWAKRQTEQKKLHWIRILGSGTRNYSGMLNFFLQRYIHYNNSLSKYSGEQEGIINKRKTYIVFGSLAYWHIPYVLEGHFVCWLLNSRSGCLWIRRNSNTGLFVEPFFFTAQGVFNKSNPLLLSFSWTRLLYPPLLHDLHPTA
jgi:hypothetical protein